jgi:hypothetical protein
MIKGHLIRLHCEFLIFFPISLSATYFTFEVAMSSSSLVMVGCHTSSSSSKMPCTSTLKPIPHRTTALPIGSSSLRNLLSSNLRGLQSSSSSKLNRQKKMSHSCHPRPRANIGMPLHMILMSQIQMSQVQQAYLVGQAHLSTKANHFLCSPFPIQSLFTSPTLASYRTCVLYCINTVLAHCLSYFSFYTYKYSPMEVSC